MDKVYQGCMLVDEKELIRLLDLVFLRMMEYPDNCDEFNEDVKLYHKLLDVKESITRERAKHEAKTESI